MTRPFFLIPNYTFGKRTVSALQHTTLLISIIIDLLLSYISYYQFYLKKGYTKGLEPVQGGLRLDSGQSALLVCPGAKTPNSTITHTVNYKDYC